MSKDDLGQLNSTYSIPHINNRIPQLSDSGFYMDILFDPNATSPNYIGLHLTLNAPTSDPNWKIYKLSYDASSPPIATRYECQIGIWDNRTTLGW